MCRTWGVFVILFLSTSCQKDEDCNICNQLNGTWNWVESVGGIGGWTLTPETEKKTKKLIIDDFVFREYENDSLIFESKYSFLIRPDTYRNTHYFITFGHYFCEPAVEILKNKLILYDNCGEDGFFHTYIRK